MISRVDTLTASVEALKARGVPAAVGPDAWEGILELLDILADYVEQESSKLDAQRVVPDGPPVALIGDPDLARSIRIPKGGRK